SCLRMYTIDRLGANAGRQRLDPVSMDLVILRSQDCLGGQRAYTCDHCGGNFGSRLRRGGEDCRSQRGCKIRRKLPAMHGRQPENSEAMRGAAAHHGTGGTQTRQHQHGYKFRAGHATPRLCAAAIKQGGGRSMTPKKAYFMVRAQVANEADRAKFDEWY